MVPHILIQLSGSIFSTCLVEDHLIAGGDEQIDQVAVFNVRIHAYNKLFSRAVAEYKKKQKRADRRITDYYVHIANGKREEAFYEAIVQFGDSKTAPCGSPNGKIVQQMLEEYVLSFQKRNPNLYIFNDVMHLDETSPHLHINFIPFYTKPRTNGPRVGVSMKAALDEMGFTSEYFKANHLVAWVANERNFMETILHAHGYEREDKHADYAHMEIEEYKIEQDKNNRGRICVR